MELILNKMESYPLKYIIVIALIFLFSCKKNTNVANNDIIELQASDTNNIKADNTQLLSITAKLPDDVADEYRSVTFETSLGTFIDNSQSKVVLPIDIDNIAKSHLKVGKQIGVCLITATIGSNTKYPASFTLEFGRAFPDSISGETDIAAISLSGSKKVKIVANLFRNTGYVSLGTQVFFEAFQSSDDSMVKVGRFSGIQNSFTDDKGIATIDFYGDTGDIVVGKKISINIKSQNDVGNPVIKTVYINVNQ